MTCWGHPHFSMPTSLLLQPSYPPAADTDLIPREEQTLVFRRALAAAVSELMDWIPDIKNPHITLSAHLKDTNVTQIDLFFVFFESENARKIVCIFCLDIIWCGVSRSVVQIHSALVEIVWTVSRGVIRSTWSTKWHRPNDDSSIWWPKMVLLLVAQGPWDSDGWVVELLELSLFRIDMDQQKCIPKDSWPNTSRQPQESTCATAHFSHTHWTARTAGCCWVSSFQRLPRPKQRRPRSRRKEGQGSRSLLYLVVGCCTKYCNALTSKVRIDFENMSRYVKYPLAVEHGTGKSHKSRCQ